MAVPNQKGQFILLTSPYTETLTVTIDKTSGRGENKNPTLNYSLRINNSIDGTLMHVENGTWMLLPNTPSGFSIARQTSMPHRESFIALGSSTVNQGSPIIPAISTNPSGQPPKTAYDYFDVYEGVSNPPGLNKKNPNATLAEAIAEQKIIQTITIHVSTIDKDGADNISFITKNSKSIKFDATFWIETVEDPTTGKTFQQLQYSQNNIIEFLPLSTDPKKRIEWPNVNINTLTKQ